ncbi:GspH/FimT family pseudopilin [Propionivibrio limicola]|uniref:GspH/FimT family pseudopilin n=1 Tax=Propionivibrio limicola TaxID=167645 RepID=UPI00147968C6|nr:GspH/FimT family pseudopilin [Propionivibrio limicola]
MTITPRRVAGVTLVEMMVVIAIAAIILAIGVPSFQQLIASERIKSAASTLQSALLLTRSEALKRNANVTLSPITDGDWDSGWNVTAADGTILSTYDPISGASISGGPDEVVFQGAGRVSGNAATFKVFSASTSSIRCLGISLSGVPSVTSSGC